MPIIHYPGYLTKAQAALQLKITERTLTDWINRRLTKARGVFYIKVDGFIFIKDKTNQEVPPAGVPITSLEQVTKFAERHKMYFERVYEQIIFGNISGVTLGDRIFVINTEPALLEFVKNYKQRRKT